MKNRRFWCLSESLFWRLQMKKIFLLRHSIPQKGNMPNEQLPLSEKGRALAISKRNIFANVDKCFSSPYRRARETAESPVCGHASFSYANWGAITVPYVVISFVSSELLGLLTMGCIFQFLKEKSGTLWMAVLVHAILVQ